MTLGPCGDYPLFPLSVGKFLLRKWFKQRVAGFPEGHLGHPFDEVDHHLFLKVVPAATLRVVPARLPLEETCLPP